MSENTENKLLTLDHVKTLKEYIDVNDNNIKYYVDTSTNTLQNNLDKMSEETKALLLSEISNAENKLNTSYQDKYNDLIKQIEDAKATGNQAAINEILLKLQALETDKNRKDTVLETLENAINGIRDSIFNAGEMYELINTALIDSVTITDEAVLAPEMYAGKLVAFIASFGEVKAENIVGGAITGHTITNTNNNWCLDNEGSGHLANGNIRWDEDGNVTFGSDVKLSWNSFDDTVTNNLSEMLENLHGSKLSVENLIDQWLDDNNISVNEIKQIQNLLNQINKERAMIETSVHNMIDNLNNIKIVVPKVEEFEDPEDNTNPSPEDNTNPSPEDNKDDIIIEEEEEEEEVVGDTSEIDYSTEPWAKMHIRDIGALGVKAPPVGGTYWFNIPIDGISYTDYINSYIPKYGHYLVVDNVEGIAANGIDVSMYVKTSIDNSAYNLYYHVVVNVPSLRDKYTTIKERNISIRLVSNIPVDQTSDYWDNTSIHVYQKEDFSNDEISKIEFYPVAASNSDIIVESDGIINSFDINLGDISPVDAETKLSDLSVATETPWINIIDSKYDNGQKLTVTYEVGANDSENTRTGQIFIQLRDPAGQWVPIHNTLESINIVQRGNVVVDVDTQAAVDGLKSEIAKQVKSLETELNAYLTAVDHFAFDNDNNSNTDLQSIITRWLDISELGTNPYRVLPLKVDEREAIRAAAAEYNDKYVSVMTAYNNSVNFLAEITGKISELKINNVRKTLNNLATDYSKLKDITNKTFIISEAYISAMADDGLLSPAEINALRQKYSEISEEYLTIELSVNTLIDAYYNACYDKQTNAFIDDELESYYDQLCSCYDTYKNTYEDVRIIFDYYTDDTKPEKDEFGNVKIVDEYDINSIPKLYKARQALLNIYYTTNSFYTTYNRFGSKSTWIGDDGVYSGTIMGDNISGWCIEGLSVQSGEKVLLPEGTEWYRYNKNASNENEAFDKIVSDGQFNDDDCPAIGPAWQINRDGTGYLASGKFKWGTDKVIIGDTIIKLGDTVTSLDKIVNDINTIRDNVSNFAADGIIGVAEQYNMVTLFNDIKSNSIALISSFETLKEKFEAAMDDVSDSTNKTGITERINLIDNTIAAFSDSVKDALDVIEYYTGVKDTDYPASNANITKTPIAVSDDYNVECISNYYNILTDAKQVYDNAVLYYSEEICDIVNTVVKDNLDELENKLNSSLSEAISGITEDDIITPTELTMLEVIKASIDADYSDTCNKITTLKKLFYTFVTSHDLTEIITTSINEHINRLDDYLSELVTAYNPVVNVLQYYNNCERDEYNNIKLNDGYSLSCINSYYTKKADIAKEYNTLYEKYTIYIDADVRDNINNLKNNIEELTSTVDNIFNDEVVSPIEQGELTRILAKIKAEYESIITIYINVNSKLDEVESIIMSGNDIDKDANLNLISIYTDYLRAAGDNTSEVANSKYYDFECKYKVVLDCLNYYTTPKTDASNDNIELNHNYELNDALEAYYAAFETLKNLLNEVATFCASYTISDNKVSDITDQINSINNLLENIGNDNHVDESERRTLSMIKSSIMREYSSTCGAIDEIRIKFGDRYPAAAVKLNILYSNETQYTAAYNKAIDVIIYYEGNSDIISSKPLSLVSDYYNAYDVVCKSIQECNLLYADLVAKEVENSVNAEIQKAVARINKLTDNVAALSGMLDESSGGVITWLNQWCADNSLNSQEINDLKIKWAECDKEYSIINDTVASTIKSLNDTLIVTEGLNSNIINDYISGLTAKYSNFTTKYEKLKVTCNHYIDTWDDLILSNNTGNDIENGTIPVESLNNMFIEIDNVNYPIAEHFGDYNGAKTDLVNYHNEAASFITSYHRFGSKLTNISDKGIYSGTITGDQITGARISGLTFESSKTCKLPKGVGFINYITDNNGNIIDLNGEYISNNDNDEGTDGPAWQIDKNGNGHLANGQIYWQGDSVHFGKNVKLSWSDNIVDAPNFDNISDSITVAPSKFKSIVFKRSDKDLSNEKVIGGSWDTPKPTDTSWEDGIPNGTGKIWMTYYVFNSNVDYNETTPEWSKPKLMVDSESFTVAYATIGAESQTSISTGLPKDTNDNAVPTGTYNDPWTNEPDKNADANKYAYMATASCDNGVWGPWIISKIKGEKGDKGGSVKLSVAFDTANDLINYYSDNVNGKDGEPSAENKDNAHIIKKGPIDPDNGEPKWENHLFVWVGTGTTDESLEDGNYFYKGWYDSGQFNGKDGKDGISSYVYIKYAKEITYNADNKTVDPSSCIPTDNGGESNNDANYIGIGHGTDPNDPVIKEGVADNWNIYKWSKISVDNIDVETPVKTAIAEYNITSNHIAAKTFDSAIDAGGAIKYVDLPNGLEVELFQTTEGSDGRYYDTGKSATVHIGDNSDKNEIFNDDSGANNAIVNGKIAKGPAWQIRKDGTGHLAGGKIYWTEDGTLSINGGAIMDGINADTNAKNTFDTMVSKHITAELIDSIEIKTDSLETKTEGADKIYIKENYLKVLDKNGNEMCEVSSNEIPTIDKDVIFNNGWIDIITDDMVANTANNSFNADLYINDVSSKTFSGVFSKEIYNNNLGYFSEGDTLFFDNVQGMEDIYLINTTIKGHNEHDFRIESVIISDFILTCELCNNNDDAKRIPVGLLSEIVKENYQFKTINDMQMVKSFLNMAYFDNDEHISITESGLYTLKWYFNFNYEFTVINENATYDKLNAPIFNVATEYADTLDVYLNKRPNQKTIIANNGVMILNAGGGMLINEEGIFLKNGKAGFRIYTDKSDPDPNNHVAKIEVCTNANDTDPKYVSLIS